METGIRLVAYKCTATVAKVTAEQITGNCDSFCSMVAIGIPSFSSLFLMVFMSQFWWSGWVKLKWDLHAVP